MPSPPELIWFQLVDSSGKPYKDTSADAVSLRPGSVIVQFRKAVKAEYADSHLKGVAPSDLKVYKNKAAFDKDERLTAGFLLSGLVTSDTDLLLVVVSGSVNEADVSVTLNLARADIVLSTAKMEYLRCHMPDAYKRLQKGGLTPTQVRVQAKRVDDIFDNAVKKLLSKEGLYVDGRLAALGQAKSSLRYVLTKSGLFLVAKIFEGHYSDFMREVSSRAAIGDHENIVCFIGHFSAELEWSSTTSQDISSLPVTSQSQNSASRPPEAKKAQSIHVITMPAYHLSVHDWIQKDHSLPDDAIRLIARDCFKALCHIHDHGYCYCDLKPANVMLSTGDQAKAVLVDFGATVKREEIVFECSVEFTLDFPSDKATEALDWTCLGSTVFAMYYSVLKGNSRNYVIDRTKASSKIPQDIKDLIQACLGADPTRASIGIAINNLLPSVS